MKGLCSLLALSLLSFFAVHSDALRADTGPAEWTVDDLIRAERATAWSLSHDGRHAAWVRTRVATVKKEEKTLTELWLSDLQTGRRQQLTRGKDKVSAPKFSPDGRYLAFLSDRQPPPDVKKLEKDSTPQIWLLPLQGGEAFLAGRLDRRVREFGWAGNDRLIALAEESPSRGSAERKNLNDSTEIIEDEELEVPRRLFSVVIEGKTSRLTNQVDWLDSLDVAPDGKYALVIAAQSLSYQFDEKLAPKTYLVDLETGAFEVLLDGSSRPPGNLAWQPDSKGFFFTEDHNTHPLYSSAAIQRLWHYDLAQRRANRVDLDWPRGIGRTLLATSRGVLTLLADGVHYRPALIERSGQGWRRTNLIGEHSAHLDNWRASLDGRSVVYRTSSATRPPQWYAAELADKKLDAPRQLTELNPSFADKPTGRVEIRHWTGALDEQVEGLLHYPLDWTAGERRPLVLDIHGGPAGTDRDTWDQRYAGPNILWRQRGAFVLQVNYHGSAGYGLEWVESIRERYYELEIPDLLAGVAMLVDEGLVDPEQMGSVGWSNGGILTAELITQDQRFKAASVGAADVEWISDWANVSFGGTFDGYYFGGPPWERLDHYIEKSPFFRLDRVTTPTIVHTGTEDTNVPPHQSWSLFRAMQQHGKAPVRLAIYPGEPHGLRRPAHQRRKLEEDLAWFDQHLFGKLRTDDSYLPTGSRLSALLARQKAAQHEGLYGIEQGGLLVPETVAHKGLQIGRFEITRGQWAALEGSSIGAGQGNHPATGMTFEEAQDYVRRLSERTGRTYRLPTRAEAKKLASSGGNTLDHWVGYSPNPADAAKLAESVAGLAGTAPLLLSVGSLPGQGEPMIFDLDGNAAEWAVEEISGGDSKGIAVGPSADRPSDARGSYQPAAEYVGFRVVLDPASTND